MAHETKLATACLCKLSCTGIHMPIHLHIAYGCFHTTAAQLSRNDVDHTTHRSTISEKNWQISALENNVAEFTHKFGILSHEV